MRLARIEVLTEHLMNLIGERNPYSSPDHLASVEEYISACFKNYGLGIREETVSFNGMESKNIFAIKPGTERGLFIIGAHYDTVQGTPGADDNASAIAALLEIAYCLQSVVLKNSLVFCGFALEEYGFVGSRIYAESLRECKEEVLGMISLEMLGYRSTKSGSQVYPPYVDASRYPDRADFIALVGNEPSADLTLSIASGMKHSVPDLPVEYLIVPGCGDDFSEIRLSDHSPFWDSGFPAVMVTDTAFFRNPNYHKPSDTMETLDLKFILDNTQAVAGFLQQHLG